MIQKKKGAEVTAGKAEQGQGRKDFYHTLGIVGLIR